MSDKLNYTIALGYYDCVHLGHREVINKAKEIALKSGTKLAVFTFDGNLRGATGNLQDKSIYTFDEREIILRSLGVDFILSAPVSCEFLSLKSNEFLKYINNKININNYVCGEDYTFGKFGAGDVNVLKEYAIKNDQKLITVDDVIINGEKISTTKIKPLLASGNITQANYLLGENYFVYGTVIKDRGVGGKIGFPTINLKLSKDKFALKFGVYSGEIIIDNKKFLAVINYGKRPTFDVEQMICEAHILGFNGDLYGENVKLSFNNYLREIIKFDNIEELTIQIQKDIKKIEMKND